MRCESVNKIRPVVAHPCDGFSGRFPPPPIGKYSLRHLHIPVGLASPGVMAPGGAKPPELFDLRPSMAGVADWGWGEPVRKEI